MKRILALFCLALLVLVVALTSAFTLAATADDSNTAENVIYISSSLNKVGKGDGSSPNDPLCPIQYNDDHPVLEPTDIKRGTETITACSYYKNTALYQAVEKLAETGGTVVICDEYTLTDDNARQTQFDSYPEFHLPINKKTVTITSKYNGVDYSTEKGAKLSLSGKFFIVLNGPTVWENLEIYSDSGRATNRAICCNGYTTVFGEKLECTTNTTLAEDDPVSATWPSIAGGTINTNFSKDVDVTIKSGTFFKVVGTSWMNGDNVTECNGDVNIKIEGGKIEYVLGNSNNNAQNSRHSGNVDITVTDGMVRSWIACTGAGGFKSTTSRVNIKISGGTFNNAISGRKVASVTAAGEEPGTINIDLSGASGDKTLAKVNTLISSLTADVNNIYKDKTYVTYPAKWATGVTKVTSPTETFVFSGEELSSTGASVSVTYNNGKTQIVEYSKDNPLFRAEYDKNAVGKTTATYKYGDKVYHTGEINVIDVPTVKFDGVQIRTNNRAQQMYGWGVYEGSTSPGVEIEKYGIIAIASEMLATDEPFDHSNTYGMYEAEADYIGYNEFRALVFGSAFIRENNYKTDYSLRAYLKIKYTDETGESTEHYVYSDVAKRNFYDVAKEAAANPDESLDARNYLTTKVIDLSDNYDPSYCYYPEGAQNARNKVVDYMNKMSNIPWTPTETFIIYNDGGTGKYSLGEGSTKMYGVFYKDQQYYGIPYINETFCQHENFLDRIEQTEIMPLDEPNKKFYEFLGEVAFTKLNDSQKAAGFENAKNFPGNDCVVALMFAWNSVINNRQEINSLTYVNNVINLRNGTIKVGDYDLDPKYLTQTDVVTQNNGAQKMAEAYAMLQKGDATAFSRSDGARHVRIVTGLNVVRNTDDTINLSKSYVNFIHQAGGHTSVFIYNNDDKSLGTTQKTFQELITEGSLPLTIPELATGNVDAEFTCASEMNLEEDLPKGVLSGTVKSNRQIISVRAEFVNTKTGETVSKENTNLVNTYWQLHTGEYNLSRHDLSGLSLKAGENYKFNLYACVSGLNGTEVHLVRDYEFTAK